MLIFTSPCIDDRSWVAPILTDSGYISADNCFGNIYLWQNAYQVRICKHQGFLLRSYGLAENIHYAFPVGTGDLRGAIQVLLDLHHTDEAFSFVGLSPTAAQKLDELMPSQFEFNETRDIADYIYLVDDLANLPGKKYHSKRNHISRFKRTYNLQYEDITDANVDDCYALLDEWCLQNKCASDKSLDDEACILKVALKNMQALNLIGGLVRADGKPVALTIGEEINNDIFVVHFEKALVNYSGSYAIINNEFAIQRLDTYTYVNREEDLGIEGLRKAKLSYHPHTVLTKYTATFKM